MSEATVGQIVGFLRLNADQFFGEIDKAERKVDELGRKSPEVDVKVKADTGGAEAKLAAVGRSAKQSSSGMDAAAVSSRRLTDASSAVSVAQLRLNELQETGKAKASQLASAEGALARARRVESDAVMATYSANIKADESLKKVDESAKKADASNKKVASSSRDAGKGLGLMATSIIALGPAIVPLAGAAVGLGGAFGGMGAAGILAIVGVKKEMAAGTVMGNKYAAQIGTLKGNLDTLSHTAASGVLSAFQKDVSTLQTRMPFLNGMVSTFSTLLGRSSTNLLTGVLDGLRILEPLMMQAGVYVDSLSAKFAAAAGGPGMQAFTNYAASVLPQVTSALESIAGAAVHLVSAFAGVGVGVVGELKLLSDIISAIPLPILSQLASAAVSVTVAFQAWKGMSAVVDRIGGAMGKFAATAEMAAGATRSLSIAAGGISAIIAVATFAYQAHAQKVAEDKQAVSDLTDALIRNGGVLDDNAIKDKAAALAKDGTLAAAKAAGYALDDVVRASMGYAPAIENVNAHTRDLKTGFEEAGSAGGAAADGANATGDAMAKVSAATQNGAKNLGLAEEAYKAYKAATDAGASSTGAAAAAQRTLASGMGMTVGALQAAEAGQKKTADAAATATQKMQLENDAAGILKQALDALNGKALSAADAQNSFDSSLTNMGDVVNKAGKKVKITTGNIGDMSTASVGLRGTLNGQIHALEGVAEANGGLANMTSKARANMETLRKQIIDNAVAHGVDRAAVTAYIDKLFKIPKKLAPTQLDADTKAANSKIAKTQEASDKVAKGRMIYIGAGNVKAMPVIAATQAASDRVAKSRLIYLAADGSRAIGVVRNVQAAVDAMHGKQVTISVVTNHIAGTDSGDTVGHGTRHATGGTIEGHAFGGTVGGKGGPRADDQPFMGPRGLVMLSSGEEVIKNGPAQKYRPLLKAINAGKFAGGGTIGAAGPAPDMNEIMALFAAGRITAADVAAARARVAAAKKSVTTATTSLHNYRVSAGAAGRSVRAAQANLDSVERGHMVGSGKHRHYVGPNANQRRAAEDRLTSALEHQKKVNGQVSAAEDKLAASRKNVTKTTKDANALEVRYKTPAIDQFKSATKKSNKLSSSFLANLTKLASRGFTTLARSLLEDGSPEAQTVAAQAVKSTAKAKGLEADLKSSAKTEAGIKSLDDKLNGVNQPPAQLKAVTLKPGESLTIGGQVIKGSPTKVAPSPQAGGAAAYGQASHVHLSPSTIRSLRDAIAARPLNIDGKSLARPLNKELVRGLR